MYREWTIEIVLVFKHVYMEYINHQTDNYDMDIRLASKKTTAQQ